MDRAHLGAAGQAGQRHVGLLKHVLKAAWIRTGARRLGRGENRRRCLWSSHWQSESGESLAASEASSGR